VRILYSNRDEHIDIFKPSDHGARLTLNNRAIQFPEASFREISLLKDR
jgi:hypothetical protein